MGLVAGAGCEGSGPWSGSATITAGEGLRPGEAVFQIFASGTLIRCGHSGAVVMRGR
jgi:hypothetical protein